MSAIFDSIMRRLNERRGTEGPFEPKPKRKVRDPHLDALSIGDAYDIQTDDDNNGLYIGEARMEEPRSRGGRR